MPIEPEKNAASSDEAGQSGGVNIQSSGDIHIAGDVAGRDKITNTVQTTIVGNVIGPVLSGTFNAPVQVGDTIVQLPLPSVMALHQLPSPPADFTGREAELAELRAALEQGGVTISGLQGLGGVGKTALAVKLADELEPHYPDAQLYLDLQGVGPHPLKPADALAHVIRAYHPEAKLPESEAELRGLYCSVLDGQRALLLMDNAKDAAQVQPLIPPATCVLLVTSRTHFTLPGLRATNLNCLPPDDAHALLLKIAGRIGERASEIAKLCGYLPLALRLAGSVLAERLDLAPDEYVQRLQKAQTRLALIDASLGLSYDLLTPEQQRLWRALAVFPAPFDRAAAAAVWSLEPDAAHDALGDLVKFSLVEWDEKAARYRLHDLARLFAAARLVDDERPLGQVHHAQHYEQVLRDADNLYEQGGDSILRGLALFDLEWPNVQAGHAWATANAEQDDDAAKLCSDYPRAGTYCLVLRLHPREQIRWREAALAAARQLKNRLAEGAHLGNLGLAYAALGEVRRAIECYEQSVSIAREIRAVSTERSAEWTAARRGEGTALGNLGLAYADLSEPRRAIELHEQRLSITREIGDRHGEGQALGNLGGAYYRLGERRRAIEYYEQYLAIAREIGDRQGEGTALGNLGVAYYRLGEPRRAIACYEQALVIFRKIGDRRGEGAVLGNLGNAYADLSAPRRAIEYYEQYLSIACKIGDRRGEGTALGNLGNAYAALGEPRRAIEFYEQHLSIAHKIGDRQGEGNALGNLGLAYAALGAPRRAIEFHDQALVIFREIGDRRGEGAALGDLGLAYAALGAPRRAIECYEQALSIAREIGDRRGEGTALGSLGAAYADLGEVRRAIEFHDQALVIFREIGDRCGEANALWNMSLALDKLDNRAQAIANAEAALIIYQQIEDPNAEKVRKKLKEWQKPSGTE